MKSNKPGLSGAVQKSREPERVKPEKVYNAKATPGRRGKRGLTIYISPMAHAALKNIAEQEDKQLQELLLEGINVVLQRRGEKPLA